MSNLYYGSSHNPKNSRQTGWEKGLVVGREQIAKGTLSLEHTLGLGRKPSVIPPGEASIDGEHRTVEIGWHPVAGMSGKWFAEKCGLGKFITKEVGKYPDPSQHWGVLVGDYVHQLWMDENLDVIYFNEKLVRADWRTFEVGKTRFTDQALKVAAEMTIHNMREKRAAYNIISNNCQNFATLLLDAIQIGAHHEFATSMAVYERATGAGTIRDLFVDKHPEEQKTDIPGKLQRTDTVQNAQAVMAENTTQLDTHKHGR